MSPRIYSYAALVLVLSNAAAFAQTNSTSGQSSPDGSNRTESRRYLPGETYDEANLARGLGSFEEQLQRHYGQTTEAQQQWWHALMARQRAARNLATTKANLTREYHDSPEIVTARKDLSVVDRQYQDARASVLQQLNQRRDYREAVVQRKDAAAMLREQTNEPLTSPLRRKLAEELRTATARIKELEDTAIQADSVAKAAFQERQAATDSLAELQANSQKALASDQRLTSAKHGFERAQRNVQLQQRAFATNRQKFAQLQQGYQQLVQQQRRLEDYKTRNSSWPIGPILGPTFWPPAGSFPNGIVFSGPAISTTNTSQPGMSGSQPTTSMSQPTVMPAP